MAAETWVELTARQDRTENSSTVLGTGPVRLNLDHRVTAARGTSKQGSLSTSLVVERARFDPQMTSKMTFVGYPAARAKMGTHSRVRLTVPRCTKMITEGPITSTSCHAGRPLPPP